MRTPAYSLPETPPGTVRHANLLPPLPACGIRPSSRRPASLRPGALAPDRARQNARRRVSHARTLFRVGVSPLPVHQSGTIAVLFGALTLSAPPARGRL